MEVGGKFPSPNVSETKVNATFFKDGSSLPELCHPSLVSIHNVAKGEPRAESREPEKHLEHRAHSFNTRARCQAALQPFTHRQPTRVCGVRTASQPLPLAQEDQGVICQL